MTYYIGIDPGATGALAVIYPDFLRIFPFKETEKFSKNLGSMLFILEKISNTPGSSVYLENVHSMPADGAKVAFTFGRMTGIIEGILKAYDFSYGLVTPQVWQKELKLLDGPKVKAARKKWYQEKAKEMFPINADQITLDVADAVLIAEYCRRVSNAAV